MPPRPPKIRPFSDKRYTITPEWCGRTERRYVVRFCHIWIDQRRRYCDALSLARDHKAKRDAALVL